MTISCWIYFQNIDSPLASRASKFCCLSSVGTSRREEAGHPALLSSCFLSEGAALTLVFSLHASGFHPMMWAASLEFPFLHIIFFPTSATLMMVLVTWERLAKAQRPRVQLSQPENHTQRLVPRPHMRGEKQLPLQLLLDGKGQAGDKPQSVHQKGVSTGGPGCDSLG